MEPLGQLKKFLSRAFNRLTSWIIPLIDLRKNLKGVTVIQPQFYYTPNLSLIQSKGIDYYWMSFSQLPLDPLFYKKINNALVVGHGIIINAESKVILESTLFQKEYLFKLGQNHLILTRFFKNKIHQEKLILSLSNVLEDNYYHWIMESVTRVLLIEPIIDIHNLIVVVNDHPIRFKKDSLLFLFEISESDVKSIRAKDVYQGSLIVPSFTHTRNETTRMTDICHPSIIRNLNKKIFDKLHPHTSSNKFATKFILSRKTVNDRRILNEEHLLDALSDKSFKIVDSADLSFEDQVLLFFNAQLVISTHGAGLTNIVFGRKITVIELFPEDRNPRDAFVFTQISAVLGFTHYIIPYSSYNKTQDVMLDQPMIQEINHIIDHSLK
jgi:hypothetical protein